MFDDNLGSLYLLYGEERYLLEQDLKKMKKRFGECLLGINYILIDDSNIDDLIYDIESPAFGYDKKLIVAKNTGLFKKDGRRKNASPIQETIANFINENIDTINENVVLIFVEDSVDKNDVYNAINKNGQVIEYKELSEQALFQNLKHITGLYKVNADNNTIMYLIQICGTNYQLLINEIRKLIEYAGPNGTFTKEDVDKLAIPQIESIIFDLTDSLGSKNTAKAMEKLEGLIINEEPLLRILSTLYNHFKKLYLTRIAMETNQDIAKALELKPNQMFLVSKYQRQAKAFELDTLRKILDEFIELNFNFKMGNIDLEVGLKSILCSYC